MRFSLRNVVLQTLLAISVTQSTNAQFTNPIAEKTADSLLNAESDTVIIFYPWKNSHYEQYSDSSVIENKCYILTERMGTLFIERITAETRWTPYGKISTRRSFHSQDSLGIFDYLSNHFQSVISDTLLPGLVKYHFNNRDTVLSARGHHPSWTIITVKTVCGTYQNRIYYHDLADGKTRNLDGSIRDHQESQNYLHNISTSIYKIIALLETQVKTIESKFE